MLLAILWASQANAVPATFWSLAFLLLPENKVHLDTVLSELKEEVVKDAGAIKQRKTPVVVDPSEKAAITQAAFRLSVDRKSSISRCVAEAVRLRVHSIDLRIAAADLRLASSTGEIVSTGHAYDMGMSLALVQTRPRSQCEMQRCFTTLEDPSVEDTDVLPTLCCLTGPSTQGAFDGHLPFCLAPRPGAVPA